MHDPTPERAVSAQHSRSTFLLALGDRLRNLTDARAITDTTAELLGLHMSATRVVYAEIDETVVTATVWSDWTDGNARSVVGRHRLEDFGAGMAQAWREGRVWRVDDAETDPRPDVRAAAEGYRAIGIRGAIVPPLIRAGRVLAIIAVHSATPRHWTDEEVALVKDVAERTWESVERARAEERLRSLLGKQQVMVDELQHRTRNLLAMVRSIAGQTIDSSDTLETFRARFDDRLAALSRVQGLLSRSDQEPITIGKLLHMELTAQGPEDALKHLHLGGPEVPLLNASVQTLSLAIHELTTNARKYGALSNERGHLEVTWAVTTSEHGERRLTLEWIETGVSPPAIRQPGARHGYGRELIERVLPHTLGAITRYEHHETTVRCTLDLPLSRQGSLS